MANKGGNNISPWTSANRYIILWRYRYNRRDCPEVSKKYRDNTGTDTDIRYSGIPRNTETKRRKNTETKSRKLMFWKIPEIPSWCRATDLKKNTDRPFEVGIHILVWSCKAQHDECYIIYCCSYDSYYVPGTFDSFLVSLLRVHCEYSKKQDSFLRREESFGSAAWWVKIRERCGSGTWSGKEGKYERFGSRRTY